MANIGKAVKLGVFTLAIMNVTAVVSLRGLPAEAVYGLSSAFYYLFAAIVFLIPTSLVAAELAAMFQDKQGGVFRWVGEAYGKKWGFLAIWVQWIESTIWYPTVLTFGAVSIAFIGMNDAHDMTLASNKMYTPEARYTIPKIINKAAGMIVPTMPPTLATLPTQLRPFKEINVASQ